MGELDILNEEFDLRYRPQVGDTSFYRLDIVYRPLDDRGLPFNRENWRGTFRRVVDKVEDSGRVVETISWRNIQRRFVEGEGEFGAPETFDWAENISYSFSAEDGHEVVLDSLDVDSFPKDLHGWNVLLLCVDAHFEFDHVRSEHHGAIGKLRQIGDSVVNPDHNRPFAIMFPPLIECPAFNKQDPRTSFMGLTMKHGEPCAVLGFEIGPSPFKMKFGEVDMESTSSFAGTVTQRLSDGAVEHGEFLEFVFSGGGVISPVYEIVRIDESEHEG